MRSHVLLPALLSFTSLAAAVPACLLGALGPQENPSDVEAVCGKDKQEALLAKLVEVCSGDALTDAYAQIVDTCGEKGIEVANLADAGKKGKSGSSSGSGKDGSEDAANGMAPSLIFLVTGLAATSLTSILFL